MKLLLSLFILLGSLAAQAEEVSITLGPQNGPVIFADRTLVYQDRDFDELIEVEITGPWTRQYISIENNSAEDLRVVAITPVVTNSRDGSTYVADTFWGLTNPLESGILNNFEGNFYTFNMLGLYSREARDDYRGADFYVQLRLEGWFEKDGEPTRNFFKTVEVELKTSK